MGFFSGIANIGSKILGGIKHAAQWVAPTLHKVLSTISGPVGMIHPGIGGALGAGANLAGAVDRLYQKRGSSSGGMLQNDEYQLFIDNDNALVYAANNQIVDGYAADYALKIAPNGLLTIKNLKVINFDFVAQINQLINEVNQLQLSIGGVEQAIDGLKNDIQTIQQELARQIHFRGYYLLNSVIQNLPNSANGDFAFSAESGTVWMYETDWYNSGDVVPDQVTPASDAIPSNSVVNGSAETCNEYARGDHQHPLQVSTVFPAQDTANGEVGVANTYARSDHTHHVNLSNDIPLKDTGTGTACTANIYASATHQHPLNIDPTTANVPLVNATAAANGTSDFYSRNDHVHPQQLTYSGPLTSTMFIKSGAQATDILLANGDSKHISDIAGDGFVAKTGKTLQAVQGVLRHSGDDEESEDDEDYITRGTIYNQYVTKASPDTIIVGTPLYINYRGTSLSTQYPNSKLVQKYVLNAGTPTSYASVTSGNVQINPVAAAGFDDGLRISRTIENTGCSSIELGCSRTSNSGAIQGQWVIYTPSTSAVQAPNSLIIAVANQASDVTRGLQISIDGNTLSFNGQVIAQTNPTTGQTTISSTSNGASNGSVQYSAGNPILWGENSTGTEGGFYSNGTNICWRARPITLGSVPP
ncbi:MAG: hypothetical protein EZS28_018732 [Streblomastix strix]|uniref:Uncharacterized protein n=2 Tax=Streblomastix strix TaxID=222440 RepID=A0A5J4VT14_9EUKA|nr:MAG: hypothetical protein EZS28_018732 [Streblomastix strix]